MGKKPPRRQRKERGSIPGQFVWRLVEMIESPPYRALSLSAHRVLARLEIELAHNAGEKNGELACTYEHFVEFGIDRHAIAPAIREVVALGFVEITRQGCAGNAEFHQPTLYRLTYRHFGTHQGITDEWRRIKTLDEAQAIARSARLEQSERRPKNKNPVGENPLTPVRETPTENARFPVGETPTTAPVGETPTTSISGRGVPPSCKREGRRPDPRNTDADPSRQPAAAKPTDDAPPTIIPLPPRPRERADRNRARGSARPASHATPTAVGPATPAGKR